jgi:flagellar motility protein MotE (MotC chaperone)
MDKTILGYILGFMFSFVTIFEGMYVLSKVYPELFRPIPKSTVIAGEIDSVKLKNDSLEVVWEDTSSIGLEYVEAYKLDSLKREFDRVSEELKKFKDSVNVLYRMVRDLEIELKRKNLMIENLQAKVSETQTEKIKAVAKIYEAMEPDKAARILENMPEDEAIAIILNMQRRQAAKVLAELNTKKATQLTRVNSK